MENRKGLSNIVATLIIILLVLVSVGIIWVVIRNVIQSGAETVSITTKCLDVSISYVSVNETTTPGVYDITLHRDSGGDNNLGGIKVSVLNANGLSSGPMDFAPLRVLDQRTETKNTATDGDRAVTGGTMIEWTPYFIDASGNEQLCSQTQTRNF